MKTNPLKSARHPFRVRGFRSRTAALIASLAISACSAARLDAGVIDDFDHGKKFWLAAQGGLPEYQFADGQLRFALPTPAAYGEIAYREPYELPEGQPVEFKLDLVSLSGASAFCALGPLFVTPSTSTLGHVYWLGLTADLVGLAKQHETGSCWLIYQSYANILSLPVTISQTLTRQGDSLKIRVKVVRKDAPTQVLFDREVTDSAGIDVSGDSGPPHPGQVVAVVVGCGSWGNTTPPIAWLDNLECSANPAPRVLGISRPTGAEVRTEWQSISLLLQADEIKGPWTLCPELITADSNAYGVSFPASEAAQFFRLVRGKQAVETFDEPSAFNPSAFDAWYTVSPVAGQVPKPAFSAITNGGYGRILGQGVNNADFLLFRGFVGNPRRDFVASVDIMSWDAAMEDAAFGFVLRVKSANEDKLWRCQTEGLPNERYAGLLTFKKAASPTESALSITGPGGEVLVEERFPAVDPAKQYRLRFWAVGDQLTLELFDLDGLANPIKTCAKTDGRITEGCDAMYGTKSATDTYDVTIDRCVVSATFP